MSQSSRSPLKVALVGCGGVAQIVHLPILNTLKNVEVVALCDIDTRKASILANRFNIAHIYDDIVQMLDTHELDLVFILTPNNMHLPMSLIALEHKVNVFLERPAARTAGEVQRIADAAKQHGCSVMVGMHSRFRPDIKAIRKFVSQKTLGDVFFIRSQWMQAEFEVLKQPWLLSKSIAGGGVLMDLGVQLIDTTWWMLGKPKLRSVMATSHQIDANLEVEDFCSFQLNFEDSATLACDISWNFPIPQDRFHAALYSSIGSLTLNPFNISKLWQGKQIDMTPPVPRNGAILFRQAYQSQLQHIVNFLQGREESLESDIQDAVEVHKILDTLYASLAAGGSSTNFSG
ncbi:MAG: Gfo/Idh/MocA family protein [Calditrichia bacterium]